MIVVGVGGLPGAGKSSLLLDCRAPIVSPDALLPTVLAEHPEMEPEHQHTLAWSLARRELRRAVARGVPVVVVDAPHLLPRFAPVPAAVAAEAGYRSELLLLDTPPDECRRRQTARGRTVDAGMWTRYLAARSRVGVPYHGWDAVTVGDATACRARLGEIVAEHRVD